MTMTVKKTKKVILHVTSILKRELKWQVYSLSTLLKIELLNFTSIVFEHPWNLSHAEKILYSRKLFTKVIWGPRNVSSLASLQMIILRVKLQTELIRVFLHLFVPLWWVRYVQWSNSLCVRIGVRVINRSRVWWGSVIEKEWRFQCFWGFLQRLSFLQSLRRHWKTAFPASWKVISPEFSHLLNALTVSGWDGPSSLKSGAQTVWSCY